jgi:glutamine amidotransferase
VLVRNDYTWVVKGKLINIIAGNFKQIRRSMLGAMSDIAVEHIVGTTDSEHLAMLFFTYLAKNSGIHGPRVYEVSHSLESIKVALEEAITTTLAIQKDKYGPVAVAGSNRESSSLNVAICDGDQLLCIRFRNHPKEVRFNGLYHL